MKEKTFLVDEVKNNVCISGIVMKVQDVPEGKALLICNKESMFIPVVLKKDEPINEMDYVDIQGELKSRITLNRLITEVYVDTIKVYKDWEIKRKSAFI